MSYIANYEGSSQIGAYARITNNFVIIGKSPSRHFYSTFQHLDIPIIETTINTIPTVGSLCQANKNGIIVSNSCSDTELMHIRNSAPENVKVVRIEERLNALGNVLLVNDRIGLLHPEVSQETAERITDVLGVEIFRLSLGEETLVGSFGCLNNVGLLVHPNMQKEEMEELSGVLEVNVVAGTINKGQKDVGGGILVNDWVGFVGHKSTVHERMVIEGIFGLVQGDEESKRKALIENLVQ